MQPLAISRCYLLTLSFFTFLTTDFFEDKAMPRIVNYPSQDLFDQPRVNEREFDASLLEGMIDEQKEHQGIVAPAFQINGIFDDNDAADAYYDW